MPDTDTFSSAIPNPYPLPNAIVYHNSYESLYLVGLLAAALLGYLGCMDYAFDMRCQSLPSSASDGHVVGIGCESVSSSIRY